MKPYYSKDGIEIYHGDCRDVLPTLSVCDLVDPPYGCGKADWDNEFPTEWYTLAKVVAETTAIITGSCGVADSVRLVGADFVDVISARNLNGMTRGPLGFCNWLAVVVAGKKPPTGWNAFEFSVRGKMPDHPSPKPIEFMRRIVERLTNPGQSILDPFAGSGTTLVAAKQMGLQAVGIEREEKYCEIAARRLSQRVLAFAEQSA